MQVIGSQVGGNNSASRFEQWRNEFTQNMFNSGGLSGVISNFYQNPNEGGSSNSSISQEGSFFDSGSVTSPGGSANSNTAQGGISPGESAQFEDNLMTYLQGLFESIGEQNNKDRLYNEQQAIANRDFQALEAQKTRDWYTEMSNTAYQRAMADMKKAGLNPILAYSQGSAASAATSSPAGSAASHQSSGGDTMSSILTSFAQILSGLGGLAGGSSWLLRLFGNSKR